MLEPNQILRPKTLILTGEGVNCENETALAFQEAGSDPTIMFLSQLIESPQRLFDFHILALPGGFSYGDEIGSGQVFALKLKKHLGSELEMFIKKKRPVIGICNGFQVLMKLGFFNMKRQQVMGLAPNANGEFVNKWVALSVCPNSHCIWTKGLETEGELPIRHGEGRVVFKEGKENLFNKFNEKGQAVFFYKKDINGSYKKIAGLCDKSGVVLGLMPHPEADLFQVTHPKKRGDPFKKSWGFKIFKNSVDYIKNNERSWS